MNKSVKKQLTKALLVLIILVSGYFYTTYFDNENITKDVTTNVKQTINESSSNLKIYFVDVGQADCILINDNNEYGLIDAGNNEDGEKIVKYFKDLGITKFKYVFGTHAHEDHIGGMDNIIENFQIEHFYMPDTITTTRTFEEVLDALEEKNIAFETPEEDENLTFSDTVFKVLHVGKDKRDLNDTSIVLKLTYKNTSYLFMGDATSSVEKDILDKDIKSDVLKVGHHGSQYSSTISFLKKASPKYAIIEVGKNNSYNHPKEVTLKKLEDLGTKIYRTDEDDTIILTSDGENMSFETVKTDTNGG